MKKRLKEVCEFYSGTGFPIKYQGDSYGDLPFYKVSDIANNEIMGNCFLDVCNNYISYDTVREIKGTVIPRNVVVFAKIGEALKLNRRCITSSDCLIDNNAMGIGCNEKYLEIKYFYFFMKNLKLEKLAESTTIPSVRKTKLEELFIEVPNMELQLEIARTLEVIQDIILYRQKQLIQMDKLIKARFVEMFGDPIINSKRLETNILKDVFILKAGDFTAASDIAVEQSETNSYPCYGGNGIRGYVAEYNQEGEYSIVGRQGALSGNVQFASGKFKNTEHALLVIPIVEMNNTWINHLLLNLDLKRYQTGAAQPGLSVKNLQEIQIISVPIDKQNQFADFVHQVNKSKVEVQKALDKAQLLFDSLMQKYFG